MADNKNQNQHKQEAPTSLPNNEKGKNNTIIGGEVEKGVRVAPRPPVKNSNE